MKIHIKNGRVIDPNSQLDSQLDVYIGAGKILAQATPLLGLSPTKP
jgi:dihydroorotase